MPACNDSDVGEVDPVASAPRAVEIRVATSSDAAALLALKRTLDHETSFMLLEPDERKTAVAEAIEELRAIVARANSVVLVAVADGEPVGYIQATGGAFRRNRHTAHVVIGVRRSHTSEGIGGRLLGELARWARSAGVLRLELTVMTSNERAVRLYRKLGYRVEGTRRAALLVEGELVDEFWMARVLEAQSP